MTGPQRIVCMTEETTEALYLMGQEHRIVGISKYTVRPPRAKDEKPMVSHFIKADIKAIVALKPDLVLGFSDLQADICAELIKAGIEVYCLNHRSVAGIIEMVRRLGRLVDAADKGEELAISMETAVAAAKEAATRLNVRPRIFFEEWPDPIITSICWVSELIEIAGGIDCFSELQGESLAKNRIVSADDVLERQPDIYLGCWCGRDFDPKLVRKRPGFADARFTQDDRMQEVPASIMLQPGPASIIDGLPLLMEIVREFASTE
ncbi:MAG: iron complex transport system substrate-binding protein [Planctomycetota bacterium]|jgi:iron complex transport system substrate-binding protein